MNVIADGGGRQACAGPVQGRTEELAEAPDHVGQSGRALGVPVRTELVADVADVIHKLQHVLHLKNSGRGSCGMASLYSRWLVYTSYMYSLTYEPAAVMQDDNMLLMSNGASALVAIPRC